MMTPEPLSAREMTPNLIILSLSAVVIAAYALDLAGRRFALPSVALLLVSGIVARIAFDRAEISLPFIDEVLPILGAVGLVLIVLEGALDLELKREKKLLMVRTLASAAIGFALSLTAIAWLFHLLLAADWTRAFLNAVPFAVISSAVAIPSTASLPPRRAEFVVYESSLSDIIGVMVFYSLLRAEGDPLEFAFNFGATGLASIALGLAFTALLYVLINRLTGHVKHLPIFFALLVLYAIGKELHLSPLMLVLAFGLLLNNAFLLRRIKWLERHEGDDFETDLRHFKQIVAEGAFLVRTFFFLLLGYSTQISEFASLQAWIVAAAVLVAVYVTRWPLIGLLARRDIAPLVWIAPRGLITVVLFLGLPAEFRIAGFPLGTVMLVVLATAVVLTFGIRTGTRAGTKASPSAPPAPSSTPPP